MYKVAADSPLYLQYHYGVTSETDFGPSLLFQVERSQENTYLNSLSFGKKVANSLFGHDVDVIAYLGFQNYSEQGLQDSIAGMIIYWKVNKRTHVPFTAIPIRMGLGQGLSYVSDIPVAEVRDFAPQKSSRLVNYLEYSIHLSLRDWTGNHDSLTAGILKDFSIGYSIFHRSSVFGLFADKGGGINYPGLGIEFLFR
jgi:hypothetical protein